MITFFDYALHPVEVLIAVLFLLVLEYIFFANNWIRLTEMGIKNPWWPVAIISLLQLVVIIVWVVYP